MKKVLKKNVLWAVFAGVLYLCIICLLPFSATAEEIKMYGDYQYRYNENYQGIEIVKYSGTDAKVTVPDMIDGMPVMVIGANAFRKGENGTINYDKKNKTLREVILPGTVVVVKEYAFYCCTNLEKVELPEELQKIGKRAFVSCINLQEINLPKNLTELPASLFASCSSLEKIEIPKNVERIGACTFSFCKGLEEVVIPADSKLEYIGVQAFSNCRKLKTIHLPSGVKRTGMEAFEWCKSLTKVTFAKNSRMEKIGSGTFCECRSLESIELPKNVKKINHRAFENCKKLRSIVFKGKVPKIGKGVFKGIHPEVVIEVPKAYEAQYKVYFMRSKPPKIKI